MAVKRVLNFHGSPTLTELRQLIEEHNRNHPDNRVPVSGNKLQLLHRLVAASDKYQLGATPSPKQAQRARAIHHDCVAGKELDARMDAAVHKAHTAVEIVGPECVVLISVTIGWPDGGEAQPINLLLLGESHFDNKRHWQSTQRTPARMNILELLRAATSTAIRHNVCLDVYMEMERSQLHRRISPEDVEEATYGNRINSRSRAAQRYLQYMAKSSAMVTIRELLSGCIRQSNKAWQHIDERQRTCALGCKQVRVHQSDPRAGLPRGVQEQFDTQSEHEVEMVMRWAMFDAPATVDDDIRRLWLRAVGKLDQAEVKGFFHLREAARQIVKKREAKLGKQRSRYLRKMIIAGIKAGQRDEREPNHWHALYTAAQEYYMLLRLLVPYAADRSKRRFDHSSPCATTDQGARLPRFAIAITGRNHTRNLLKILERLNVEGMRLRNTCPASDLGTLQRALPVFTVDRIATNTPSHRLQTCADLLKQLFEVKIL